jgi:hypothetical protein
MDADQLLLALEGAEAKKPEAASSAADALAADTAPKRQVKKRKKKGGITEELLASLPAVEIIIDPEEVRAEPEACKRHVQRPMKLLASYRRALDKYRLYEQRSDDLEAGRGWARHDSFGSANRTGSRV